MYSLTELSHLSETQQRRFNFLIDKNYNKVYNLAYKLTGNRSDAEDLTQDTFYRAYKAFNDFEGDKPFENWAYRILVRLFYDMIRNKNRRIQAVSFETTVKNNGQAEAATIDVADQKPNPEQNLLKDSVSEKMAYSLGQLKQSQRLLVLLADVEELPYKDIARIIGIPVGTVRSRLHRAHKALRVHLEGQPN